MNIVRKELNILAYHGTEHDLAMGIVSDTAFTAQYREDHWLGQGVYFFREDYKQAETWAFFKMKAHKKTGKLAVIEKEIYVDRKNILNLNSREGMQYFKKFREALDQFLQEENIEITTNKENPHMLRCFYCDRLPKEVKVVEAIFEGDSKLNELDQLKDLEVKLKGIQVCVRDLDLINKQPIKIVLTKEVSNSYKKRNKRNKGNKQKTFEESDLYET
ncbi:hypothetical protein [Bacillus cereus]|uniref:hypothetical protein n=1 Tax=Bacillus cereus TaxID=1396 RepID=UPI0007FB1E40|nr:hypothetical protein [Bacillus cereus]OBW55699.1 hypothetical protein A9987_26110 [Bacillus cereus]